MITRKQACKLGIVLCGFIALWLFFNIETSTRQGINYQVRELKIPLYLKILNFLFVMTKSSMENKIALRFYETPATQTIGVYFQYK